MSGCGEQASPHLVIDVMIQAAETWLLEGSPRQIPATVLTAVTAPGSSQCPPSGWLVGRSELGVRERRVRAGGYGSAAAD